MISDKNKNIIKISILIFIVILTILSTVFVCTHHRIEKFWFIPAGMHLGNNDLDGKDCVGLPRHDCKRTANCGWCSEPNDDINAGKCVHGDWNGNISKDKCTKYEYGLDYRNLSLVDPEEPYFIAPNTHWNWTQKIFETKQIARPIESE